MKKTIRKQIAIRCRKMWHETQTVFGGSLVACVAVLYFAYLAVYALADRYL